MTTDLTRAQFPTEFFTISVRNFKVDPTGEQTTLHGLFTDKREAEKVAVSLLSNDILYFLHAEVVGLNFATVDQVETSQNLDPSFREERLARESQPAAARGRRTPQEDLEFTEALVRSAVEVNETFRNPETDEKAQN